MTLIVPVESILARATARSRTVYTHLLTTSGAAMDMESGWSSSYLTQQALADDLDISVTTTERALRGLRHLGICRVIPWPGAATETQLRVADIRLRPVFGPAANFLDQSRLIDAAVRLLQAEWAEILDETRKRSN
ncbi:hypothetical protein ACFVGM_08810 [Kitasatospora purpeofusca]|uniref:hypothetical protein n=1 Tax=Kitasatospora purpeofusca TaxID=67352 RepID=UPI0036B773EB